MCPGFFIDGDGYEAIDRIDSSAGFSFDWLP